MNNDAVATALQHERARVARDLHDIVLQDLTAILLQLRAAGKSNCLDSLITHIGHATCVAEQGLASARSFLHELRSEEADLARADCTRLSEVLQEAVARVPHSGAAEVLCEFSDTITLPRAACGEIALILREALSNALRHAGARQVLCEALPLHGMIELRVSDDGRGFLPGACDQGMGLGTGSGSGLGLGGMCERASLLGGMLAVHSVPGSGTMIRLRLPVAARSVH